MVADKVFTAEELANYLRVPEAAIQEEIAAGRLRALRIAGHIRVRESDFEAYLRLETAEIPTHVTPGNAAGNGNVFRLAPATDFTHLWPAKEGEDRPSERYTEVREGTASYGERQYHVRVGFTFRDSAGRRRRRSLVLVNRYPTVEFVASDAHKGGRMASIIRDRTGKQIPVGTDVPPEYRALRVGPYGDVVKGPGASNGMAVICESDDLDTMVKHALIRYRYRQDRV